MRSFTPGKRAEIDKAQSDKSRPKIWKGKGDEWFLNTLDSPCQC